MNLRLAGSDLLAPEPGDFRARGFTTRPGCVSEPDIDCSESLRGRGLIMRSEGLPLRDAEVMLMLESVAILVEKMGGCGEWWVRSGLERRRGVATRRRKAFVLEWRGDLK